MIIIQIKSKSSIKNYQKVSNKSRLNVTSAKRDWQMSIVLVATVEVRFLIVWIASHKGKLTRHTHRQPRIEFITCSVVIAIGVLPTCDKVTALMS